MIKNLICSLLLFCSTCCFELQAQDTISLASLPSKFIDQVSGKAGRLNHKMELKTQRTLASLEKLERKMQKRLEKKDSSKAAELVLASKDAYQSVRTKLATSTDVKQYVPSLDTLSSSLRFLQGKLEGEAGANLKKALANTAQLQQQFNQAEMLKEFIRQRRQLLKEQLGKLGLVRELKQFNKKAYYYGQQIAEFKNLMADHRKAERKALELLSRSRWFQKFMSEHSLFASLFRAGSTDINDPTQLAALAGLQTRSQVTNLIQQQIASGGPNAQNQFNQNMQSAQSQMNDLQSRVLSSGGTSSDMIMPEGFKPNMERSKSFLQRIQFGVDFQTTRHNSLFPVASDLGFSASYPLNSNSNFAVGSSFKMGWGTGFNHIRISNQGFSVRSGIDWRIKGSIFIAGNYEQNFFPELKNIQPLQGSTYWKQSALIGLSKKISRRKGRGGDLKVLYDFMYNQAPIRTQPLTIRFGYNIK